MRRNAFLWLYLSLFRAACAICFVSCNVPSFLNAQGNDIHSPQDQEINNLSLQQGPVMSKICLTMIVKNESRIIERCLNSVKGIVDYISICDTGSTDNTVELIEKFMDVHRIPGKIHHHTWKNFGHNRSLSYQAAKESLQQQGFPLSHTYMLLLDADMILDINSGFNKTSLRMDAYYLRQRNYAETCYNIRLIRASKPWECVGPTHEYWACGLPYTCLKFQGLEIDDFEDGGSKADKYERDIRLLSEELSKDPNNARNAFYLAQSYRALKKNDEAIQWYQKRIELGGWKEEVWYSKLSIAKIYDQLGYWPQALHYYLEAYSDNPTQAEPLYHLATHYRTEGQNHLAHLFAKEGLSIPYPQDPLLFVYHAVYDYLLDFEMSIAAFYTPYKSEGFDAANRLLLKKNLPDYVKEYNSKNMLYYVENLKDAKLTEIQMSLPQIREDLDDRYNPMNASIVKTEKGYLVLCRTVNFIRNSHEIKHKDPLGGVLESRNFLLEYDSNFKLLSQKEVVDDFPRKEHAFPFKGLEDCRLFHYKNELWFTCATFGTHPDIIGQTLCKLAYPSSEKVARVKQFTPLQVPDPKRYEKNWLPFVKDDTLYAIYSYEPWTIYKINMQTGEHETVAQNDSQYNFSQFKGSAAPVNFDDGYLMLVHETIYTEELIYLHRFVFLDKDFKIKKLSKPFSFTHKGIEFCLSLTIDHTEKQCIMPVNIKEKEAWICKVPLETIRSLLETLP